MQKICGTSIQWANPMLTMQAVVRGVECAEDAWDAGQVNLETARVHTAVHVSSLLVYFCLAIPR
jgi:hypothetical protein